jgi:class 3 adenylate cyclase
MIQFNRFLKNRFFKDIKLRVAHAFILTVLTYTFIALPDALAYASDFAPSGIDFSVDLPLPKYTQLEMYTLLVFSSLLLFVSNLSYLIRSVRFDFYTQYVPLIGLVLVYWFGSPAITSLPSAEMGTLFVVNSVILGAVRLSRSEKDQTLMKSIFGKYIDKEVADNIISQGEDYEFDGQMREMTVLFSDIRGFTSLSESLHPKRLIASLNYYLDTMTDVIINNRGTIDKFIGDAIMAFWNAPLKDSDHSKKAIKTALNMQAKMNYVRSEIPELSETKIGIGIARGPMVVGNVGGKNRFDYTVLGDTVNLASRLESLTKHYGVGILVNQAACDPMRDVIYRQIDVITVKGKTKAVTIYEPMHNTNKNVYLKNKYEYAYQTMIQGNVQRSYEIFSHLANQGDGASRLMLTRLGSLQTNRAIPKVWQWDSK